MREFWEIPLYDREGYFHDNPIDRYSLNSYMLKQGKLHTADGKLVIYVQNDEPKDANQRKNWLPAPKEGFQFAARFYGPAHTDRRQLQHARRCARGIGITEAPNDQYGPLAAHSQVHA